jgi:hypothetical protein
MASPFLHLQAPEPQVRTDPLREVQYEKRSFNKDVHICPKCGGHRKTIAWITEPEPIAKILNHLGLSTEIPASKPARAPPQLGLF